MGSRNIWNYTYLYKCIMSINQLSQIWSNSLPTSYLEKTLSTLIEDFLNTKKSSETRKAYSSDILTFFDKIWITTVGELGSIPTPDLSKLIINYIESYKIADADRKDRVRNPRTLNRKAYALSSFFAYLVAHYWYARNPVKVYIPYSTADKTSTQDLDQEEVINIRNYVKDLYTNATTPLRTIESMQKLLIVAFLMLSLRRNEIAHLRRDDIDYKKQFITIFGKGQKYKYIPLNDKIMWYLETFKWLKQAQWFYSDYILSPLRNHTTSNHTKALTGSAIFKHVQNITKKLKAIGQIDPDKNITPHSFRTTFVKMALDKGKTDIEIMNTTWHSTAQMVKYYDSRSALEVNAAGVIDDLFE